MIDQKLLEDIYNTLYVFCGEEAWRGTLQGNLLERFAKELNKPCPYIYFEEEGS